MVSQILVCLAGLVAGILFSCGIPEGHLLKYLLPAGAAFISSLLWKSGVTRFPRARILSVLTGFLCFFLTGWISVSLSTFEPTAPGGASSEILARVVSYRKVTDKLAQVVVRVGQERAGPGWEKRSGKMVLLMKPGPRDEFRPGDLWQFRSLRITAVSAKPVGNGFVPSRYWLSRGVRFEARLAPGNGTLIRKSRFPSLRDIFGRYQQRLADRTGRLPLSEQARALIKAMILGDRSDVADSTITDFSRAGIIHVLSVSGLHVGIIYFLIAWILKATGLLGARLRSVGCLLVVWLYAGITGFSPSALRSAGMITLFEFSRLGRRGTPGLQVLTSTALIHCLIDPYTIFSAGAQLSYLAVAGIFIWNPFFNGLTSKLKRLPRYFASTIAVSLSAQSLITPVLLFWFGSFPLYFLLGNVFLLPVMVLCFYLGLLITVMDLGSLTVAPLNRAMDAMIGIVTQGAGWLGNLPGNLVKSGVLGWSHLVIYYLVLHFLWSYADKPEPARIRRMIAGIGLIFLVKLAEKLLSG